jgi:hypothetical protein
MPVLFCLQPSCGSKITYSGVKPAKCPYCDGSTDPLKAFRSIVSPNPEAPGIAAKAAARPVERPVARRIDRWSTEGNVVASESELAAGNEGDTLESIGLDKNAFARVTGEIDTPMTVESLRKSDGGFVRPTLSPEEQAIKQEAMKHMIKN